MSRRRSHSCATALLPRTLTQAPKKKTETPRGADGRDGLRNASEHARRQPGGALWGCPRPRGGVCPRGERQRVARRRNHDRCALRRAAQQDSTLLPPGLPDKWRDFARPPPVTVAAPPKAGLSSAPAVIGSSRVPPPTAAAVGTPPPPPPAASAAAAAGSGGTSGEEVPVGTIVGAVVGPVCGALGSYLGWLFVEKFRHTAKARTRARRVQQHCLPRTRAAFGWWTTMFRCGCGC